MATTGSGYVRPAMPMPANASPNHCSPAPSILLNPTGTGPCPRGRERGSSNASGSILPNGGIGSAGAAGTSPSSSRARSQSAASNSSLASSVPTSSTSTSTSISGDPSPRFAPLPEVKVESEHREESKGIQMDGGREQNGQAGAGGSLGANGSISDEPESEYSESDSLAPLSSEPSGSGSKNGDWNTNANDNGNANANGNGNGNGNGNPHRPRRGSSVTFAPLPQVPPELKRRSSITLGVAARKNLLTSQGQARKQGVVYMTDEDWEVYKKQYEANHGDEPVDLGEIVTSGVKSLWRKVRSSSQFSQASSGSTASASTAPSTSTSTSNSASASATSSGRSGIFGRRGSASGSASGSGAKGSSGPVPVPVSGVSGSPPVSPASTASTLATVSEEGSASPVSSPGTGLASPHALPTHPRHPQHPHDAVELLHFKPDGVDAGTSTLPAPSAPPHLPAPHAMPERRGSAPDVGFASWAPHHHARGEGHFPMAHSNILPPERAGTPPATTSTTTLASESNGELSAEERARQVEEHRVALGQLGLDGVGEDDGSETPRRPSTPTQRDMRQNAGRLWRTPSDAGEVHKGGQRSAAVLGFDQERYGYSER